MGKQPRKPGRVFQRWFLNFCGLRRPLSCRDVCVCACTCQEYNTSKITNAFKNLLPANALCTRDGNESELAAPGLVIGDVVRIRSGTRVPADLRLIFVNDVKVWTRALLSHHCLTVRRGDGGDGCQCLRGAV